MSTVAFLRIIKHVINYSETISILDFFKIDG